MRLSQKIRITKSKLHYVISNLLMKEKAAFTSPLQLNMKELYDVDECKAKESKNMIQPNNEKDKNLASISTIEVQSQSSTLKIPSSERISKIKKLKKKLQNPNFAMWTSSHEANNPSEDRSASLVNVLLRPPDSHISDKSDESKCCDGSQQNSAYIRLSLWGVFDGHGGGSVATYASKVLLPHIAQSISNELNCKIGSKGEFKINGVLQDSDDSEWDNLVQCFKNSRERNESYENVGEDRLMLPDSDEEDMLDLITNDNPNTIHYIAPEGKDLDFVIGLTESHDDSSSSDRSYQSDNDNPEEHDQDTTSIKNMSLDYKNENDYQNKKNDLYYTNNPHTKVGTHSRDEAAIVTKAICNSFLSIDEGFINSIDSSRIQTSCVGGGMWNVGACALVVGLIQRIEFQIQDENKTLPIVAIDDNELLNLEEKIDHREEDTCTRPENIEINDQEKRETEKFRSYDAMLYTAHCGDCRSVLGTTIYPDVELRSVGDSDSDDVDSDDDCSESSFEVSDNSESSDYESSDEDESDTIDINYQRYSYMTYSRHLTKRSRHNIMPYQPKSLLHLPNINISNDSRNKCQNISVPSHTLPSLPSNLMSVDLTVDHSAYNQSEAKLVRERCNDAPRAISPSSEGGIQRVAGSLAVTRALGDAYLKTPKLSFHPYKRHAPFISALPQVSRRILTKDEESDQLCDRILVLATDGVWERSSGKDVIRWVKEFYRNKYNHDGDSSKRIERGQDGRRNSFYPSYMRNRKRTRSSSKKQQINVADFIVRRVLNEVRRARNLTSLRALLALPKGRSRRSKHDDITASIVDLSSFVC